MPCWNKRCYIIVDTAPEGIHGSLKGQMHIILTSSSFPEGWTLTVHCNRAWSSLTKRQESTMSRFFPPLTTHANFFSAASQECIRLAFYQKRGSLVIHVMPRWQPVHTFPKFQESAEARVKGFCPFIINKSVSVNRKPLL